MQIAAQLVEIAHYRRCRLMRVVDSSIVSVTDDKGTAGDKFAEVAITASRLQRWKKSAELTHAGKIAVTMHAKLARQPSTKFTTTCLSRCTASREDVGQFGGKLFLILAVVAFLSPWYLLPLWCAPALKVPFGLSAAPALIWAIPLFFISGCVLMGVMGASSEALSAMAAGCCCGGPILIALFLSTILMYSGRVMLEATRVTGLSTSEWQSVEGDAYYFTDGHLDLGRAARGSTSRGCTDNDCSRMAFQLAPVYTSQSCAARFADCSPSLVAIAFGTNELSTALATACGTQGAPGGVCAYKEGDGYNRDERVESVCRTQMMRAGENASVCAQPAYFLLGDVETAAWSQHLTPGTVIWLVVLVVCVCAGCMCLV
eukprot:6683444-Prymnesium_polylepis.1